MTDSSSPQSPVFRTRLRTTDILKQRITARYQIVCSRKPWPQQKENLTRLTATTPSCPKGIMQFQHGTYEKNSTGALILTPFGVDGRQLLSDPCSGRTSVYTRYVQKETFKVRRSEAKMLRNWSLTLTEITEVRSFDRRLQQRPTSQPVLIRWESFKSHVSCLQASSNAAHTNVESYRGE